MNKEEVIVASGWTLRKIVRAALIIMILVLFPLISWMYLRGGIEFRKDALAALSEKASIGQVYLQTVDSKEYILGAGNKRVFACFMVYRTASPEILSNIAAFEQQFNATGEVEVLIFAPDGEVLPKFESSDIQYFDALNETNTAFLNQLKSVSESADVFLLDISGNLRNYYEYDTKDAFRNLVTHTAVLIPPNNNRNVRQRNKSEL